MVNYSLVLIFFTISGAMQGWEYVKLMEQYKSVQWAHIGKSVIYRYVRFLPLYAYLILFRATIFVRMQDGPFWPRMQQPSQTNCRRNWWANLLFINNYFDATKQCMVESWFLAVDMQLYVISTVVLLLVWKFPQHKFRILFSVVFVSSLIPGVVAYFKELEGFLLLQPESVKYNLIDNQTYHQLYISTFANLSSFFIGTFGVILLQFIFARNTKWNEKNKVYFMLAFLVSFLTVIFSFIVYKKDFGYSSWRNALFVILQKSGWGVLAITTYTILNSKVGENIRIYLKMKIFRILGRLSFSVYLCHLIVIQYMIDGSRQPLHLKSEYLWLSEVLTIILSYCLALVLCLTIEYPAVVLQNLVFGSDALNGEDKKFEKIKAKRGVFVISREKIGGATRNRTD
jgi:peptidoglycan/LPS O-acetylase OafA/YrhL